MYIGPVVVNGRLRADGTLELSDRVDLPPGEVQVTIQPISPQSQAKEDLWIVMERIWAEQRARGLVPRTRQEIDAEIDAIRDEAEEEMREVEAIDEECQRRSGDLPAEEQRS